MVQAQLQHLRLPQTPPHQQHSPQHAMQYPHAYNGNVFEAAAPGWPRYEAQQHYGERAPLLL